MQQELTQRLGHSSRMEPNWRESAEVTVSEEQRLPHLGIVGEAARMGKHPRSSIRAGETRNRYALRSNANARNV